MKHRPYKYRGPTVLTWDNLKNHEGSKLDDLSLKDFATSSPVNGWYRIFNSLSHAQRKTMVRWSEESKSYQCAMFHGVLYFRYRQPIVAAI